jgi:hypothetical protein
VNFSERYRALLLLFGAAGLGGCAADEDDVPLEATLADCGSSLESAALDTSSGLPDVGASYSEALAVWPDPSGDCGLGAFVGECADGKRVLYRNGGFVSEIRYFDGERLVGIVSSGDLGFCPSVCPFSHYYGPAESVRCDAPSFTPVCPGALLDTLDRALFMPFANGEPPGGCE